MSMMNFHFMGQYTDKYQTAAYGLVWLANYLCTVPLGIGINQGLNYKYHKLQGNRRIDWLLLIQILHSIQLILYSLPFFLIFYYSGLIQLFTTDQKIREYSQECGRNSNQNVKPNQDTFRLKRYLYRIQIERIQDFLIFQDQYIYRVFEKDQRGLWRYIKSRSQSNKRLFFLTFQGLKFKNNLKKKKLSRILSSWKKIFQMKCIKSHWLVKISFILRELIAIMKKQKI